MLNQPRSEARASGSATCLHVTAHAAQTPGRLLLIRSVSAAQVAPLLGSSDEPRSAPDVSSYPLEPADTDSSDMPAPTGMATGPESGAPMGGGGDNDGEAAREGYVLLGSDSAQVAGGDVTDSAVPPQVRWASYNHPNPRPNDASNCAPSAEYKFPVFVHNRPSAIDLSQAGACNL